MTEENRQQQITPQHENIPFLGAIKFVTAAGFVSFMTWGITTYMSIKSEQQEELDDFISSMSKLMIDHQLWKKSDGVQRPQASVTEERADLPEPYIARAYALNTLESFDGNRLIRDIPKKEKMLKFLYESKMIGYCPSPLRGTGENQGGENSRPSCSHARFTLKDANLSQMNFQNVSDTLRRINLTRTNLEAANFRDTDLSDARIISSNLRRSTFRSSKLRDADLSRSFLQNADLRGADLSGADLSGAQLCGANLDSAKNLDQAVLGTMAAYDRNTRFPAGYKPPAQIPNFQDCVDPPPSLRER